MNFCLRLLGALLLGLIGVNLGVASLYAGLRGAPSTVGAWGNVVEDTGEGGGWRASPQVQADAQSGARSGAETGRAGEPSPATQPGPGSSGAPVGDVELLALLEKWRMAWESKDLVSYCACYSGGFLREGMDRTRFCADKASKFKRAGQIKVGMEELEILPSDGGARVRFIQSYSTDGYRDRGRKTMDVVREGEALRIVAEDFRPLEGEPADGEINKASGPPAASGATGPEPSGGLAGRKPSAYPAPQPAIMHGMRMRQYGDAEVIEILLEGVASPAISQPVPGRIRVVLLPARSGLTYGPELRSGFVEDFALREGGGDHPSLILDFDLASPTVRPGPPVVDERGIRIRLAPTE